MLDDAARSDGPVLVGVAEGAGQEAVVRYAAQQASMHGRPLHVLHATEQPPGRETAPERGTTVVAPLVALARAEFPGLQVTAEAVPGRPAAVLLERSSQAAWLVVGHRGSGGFARLPLGSVSWQVATHADCPVVVVRPGGTSAPPENRVVVGVDVSDVSGPALDLAFAEAELRGARLEMLHASFHLGQMPGGPGMVVPDFDAFDNAAREVLAEEAAKRRDRYPDVGVDVRLERVRPATVLAEASRGAALLVVGSHGRTGLRRLLLGSVSAEVLHTAECPVAVVPPVDGTPA
ncbi:universal stress protein [Streptomyces sp. SYSU K217416]